jgi:hypothetical protein
MTIARHVTGTDAAVVLYYKGPEQSVVAGLTATSIPGITRQMITVDELRTELARQFAGGASYGDFGAKGNYVLGDSKGQDKMRQLVWDKTVLTHSDLMVFLNNDDFIATDLANDPRSGIQILEAISGEADKNAVYPFSTKFCANGRLAVYSAHVIEDDAAGLAFVDGIASNDTITDAEARFVSAGFEVGMTLMIIGSTGNDGVHATITAVAAGTLTLSTMGALTDEAGVAGCELHGGKI